MSVEVSMCRFRKQLPRGHGKVTIGSGCVINLKSNSDESNNDVFLVTTTQVVTKDELLSKNTGITAEFLNKRQSFGLNFVEVYDIPDAIPGRVLAGMESSEAREMPQQVSFLIIPAHKFDNRSAIFKKFLPFSMEKKRPMPSRSQSDVNLQSAITNRQVLCHVICDDGRSDGYFNTEPYCLEFCEDTNEFILTSVLGRDSGGEVKSLKDLHKAEKPWGALLMNAEGEFVGMLAVGTSDERKLYPLFLPNLGQDNQSSEGGQQAVASVTQSTVSDQVTSDQTDTQKEKINFNLANYDQQTGNGFTSMGQGSSKPYATSPLMVVDLPKAVPSGLPPSNEDLVPDDQNGHDEMEHPVSQNSSFEINEDAHQPQITNPQHSRPNLATQHSYHSESLSSVQGYGVRETTSLPPGKDEPPGHPYSTGTANDQSQHSDADRPNLPRRSQSDVFGPGTPTQSPRLTRHNTTPAIKREHILAGSFVKDEIVSKTDIMDVLVLHLDRSVCRGVRGVPVTRRWEHLADQFKVPDEIKRECENFTGNQLSPSEALFDHLCAAYDSLTIGEIKSYLKKLGRNDVFRLRKNTSRLKDECTVTELCENHPETLCSVCIKLDDKRSIKNWRHLAIEIGVNEATLRRLRDPSGYSPSEAVLTKIQTLKPRLSLKKLTEDINLPGVTKLLDNFSDRGTIQSLLDDVDILDHVTTLLDQDEKCWQRVGRLYGIDKRLLDSLKPDAVQSPTRIVMDYIVKNEPTVTMETFLRSLENIERFDVIEDLKDFFYANDIDGILQAEGPSPL